MKNYVPNGMKIIMMKKSKISANKHAYENSFCFPIHEKISHNMKRVNFEFNGRI